ncbi:ATP-dependent DNA ligase [Streptomyces cacaoi]|uniref:ATP-dependent DNA ligase n=1 Tax=Streptomyces cacaoi TaxID=1898 RepID=UPI003748216F
MLLCPPLVPMLARSRPALPAGGVPPGTVAEQKIDGYRLVCFARKEGTVLQSRRGSDMAGAFPDLAAAASALGRDLVLDGELVVLHRGRLDFDLLQQRARRRGVSAHQAAEHHPAAMIVFDVLEHGVDLLPRPYRERRAMLEELFSSGLLAAPFSLCPATGGTAQALAWMDPAWGAVGIEGVVLKKEGQRYLPGERAWEKVRTRITDEAVIGSVTGSPHAPASLLLGRYDMAGDLRLVARTTPLARRMREALAPHLESAGAGHPWHGVRFSAGWGSQEALVHQPVDPGLVAEFLADTAVAQGRYRHPVSFLRLRGDMMPGDLPLLPREA